MTRKTVRLLLSLAAAAGLFLGGAALGPPLRAQNDPNQVKERLQGLLKDRLAIRKQLIQRYDQLRRSGGASELEVLQTTRDMLWAELDLYDKKVDRIPVLMKIVDHEKRIVAFFDRTPDTSDVEKLMHRIRLLDAQISLERERLKKEKDD